MAPKHVQLQIFIQADITNGKKKLPGNCTLQYVVMLMIMSYISKLQNSLQKQKWN